MKRLASEATDAVDRPSDGRFAAADAQLAVLASHVLPLPDGESLSESPSAQLFELAADTDGGGLDAVRSLDHDPDLDSDVFAFAAGFGSGSAAVPMAPTDLLAGGAQAGWSAPLPNAADFLAGSIAGLGAANLDGPPVFEAPQTESRGVSAPLTSAGEVAHANVTPPATPHIASATFAAGPAATDLAQPADSGFSLQYKGFDYVAFYNGAYENSDSLPSLTQTGANSIEATLDYGIDAQTSQVVADPNYTDSLTALGDTIAQAESMGLSVMVRPLIDFLNTSESAPYSVGDWRGNYHPTNVATFFASYQQMIVSEAEVAQANGAQMLSIGAELDQLTGTQYLPYWTQIINAVRDVFSGSLTYSANWNTAGEVSFWSQLNYEGIDCYIPLSNAANPTLQQLVNGWLDAASSSFNPGAYAYIGNQSPIQYFESLAAASGKPLIFTELGYPNDTDAAATPWADGNSPDPSLQSELYQAFFQAWEESGSSSLIGTYFWEWDPNGSTSNVGPNIDSFSPQNSPAQQSATAGFEAQEIIAAGATMEISGADSGSVAFGGATGLLKLDDSQAFGGQVFNFTGDGALSSSDQIDLKDIAFGSGTAASYAGTFNGGMLTVGDASGDTANIALVGNYAGSSFAVFSDGSGGTIVIDSPAARPLAHGALFFDSLSSDVTSVSIAPQDAAPAYSGSLTVGPAASGQASWSFELGGAPAETVTQSYDVTAGDGQPSTETRSFSVTVGGPDDHTFTFGPGLGWDVVANATRADTFVLSGFSGRTGELATLLQEAQSGEPQSLFQSTHHGEDTVIHPGGGDRITLLDVHLTALRAGNFIIE